MNQNKLHLPKKIAAFNDLAGYGRCSLAVQMPVLSAMGHQCCPIPTAVLSSTDGVKGFFLHDLTRQMPEYLAQWKNLNLLFDGFYTGYFSSVTQLEIALHFLKQFRREGTLVLVDPVLGDQGQAGSNCTEEMITKYHLLFAQADIITPNLTEAAFLSHIPYQENFTKDQLDQMGKRLLEYGPKHVIITGIPWENRMENHLYHADGTQESIFTPCCRQERIGSGDLFASILLGGLLSGDSMKESAQKAADFIFKALSFSEEMALPIQEGIGFEPFLAELSPYDRNIQWSREGDFFHAT